MQVEIREGGDGILCWNAEAVHAYAASVNEREAQLAAANPDLVVIAGRVHCYGCEVLEYDMGTRCTATLTRTIYTVDGEVAPRREDADASLSQIPGLLTRIDPDPASLTPAPEPAPLAAPAAPTRRGGLLGRLGRRG